MSAGRKLLLVALLTRHPSGGHHVPHVQHRAGLADVWSMLKGLVLFVGLLVLAVVVGVLLALGIHYLYHATGGGAYGGR